MKGIRRAALEISYDNGGINRMRSEADLKRDLRAFLRSTDLVTAAELRAVDRWLSALTDEEMNTVCCAEETEMQCFMRLRGAPPKTNDLLNEIFERVG